MSAPERGPEASRAAPSVLDLVRLSPRLLFPPGGRDLYRQIAVLTGMDEGDEVLDVGCGKAVTLEYFVTEFGVHGSGIESDPDLVQAALARARERGLADRLQVQEAPSHRLPYRDEIFDVAVGELGMTAHADPADAVRELVRVTRPGGAVVLIQLVWTAPVDLQRRRVLGEHLGVQPLMLVEWKRLLREAGITDLHIEDWTDPETSFRPTVVKPFPDFAELFSIPEKLGILRRAWRRWGWPGIRTVLSRQREVHRLLTRERILALDLIKGVKAPTLDEAPEAGAAGGVSGPRGPISPDESAGDEAPSEPEERDGEHHETHDLPLFTSDDR